MEELVLQSHDGVELRYACEENQGKPWISLIMPFGMKLRMAEPFINFFKDHYSIITWEARSVLDPLERDVTAEEFAVENHVKDQFTLLDHLGLEQCILVGYCSGAGIALAAINEQPDRFSQLVLVHGEYTMLEEPGCTTHFAADIDSLLSMAANSEKHAALVHERIKSERLEASANLPDGIDEPYSELTYLRRHAMNYLAYKSVDYKALAASVQHKTFLLTGARDVQANVESSQLIKSMIENSRIYVDPRADHYGMIREASSTMIAIWNYLSEQIDG
ncbi:MAG: alpha/beta hydrolase [Wenzhouxiangellaceae bacterium]